MTDFERLVALIDQSLKMHIDKSCNLAENIAKDLTYEGVIVTEDRELIVKLPFPIGTKLYRVTYPYRQEPKVTTFIVKNFRTIGKKHRLQVEVQAVNVPVKNWMDPEKFYTDHSKAVAELNKILGGKNG